MMRLSFIFLMLFYTAAHAADLVVAIKETKTGRETLFRIDADSLLVRKMQPTNSHALAKIARYKAEKRKLVAGDKPLMKADDVLFQCSAGDADFVVVRQEHNSICTPLRVLSAFAGHPVQVSKIVFAKIAGGELAGQTELRRKASSYFWTATISQ